MIYITSYIILWVVALPLIINLAPSSFSRMGFRAKLMLNFFTTDIILMLRCTLPLLLNDINDTTNPVAFNSLTKKKKRKRKILLLSIQVN